MRQRRSAKSKSACYPRFIADHVAVELAADACGRAGSLTRDRRKGEGWEEGEKRRRREGKNRGKRECNGGGLKSYSWSDVDKRAKRESGSMRVSVGVPRLIRDDLTRP